MVNMKCVLTLLMVVVVLTAVGAQAQVVQTPLNPNRIPKFVQPLPLLDLEEPYSGLPVVDGTAGPQFLSICEFQTTILPAGTLGKNTPAPLTWVWGYQQGQTCSGNPGHPYIGPVVVAERGTPAQLTFINRLGNTATSNLLAYTQNTDQTLHWADPINHEDNLCAEQLATWEFNGLPQPDCALNYAGPIPAAVHLHGGEVPPDLDGGPDSWWTPDGQYKGHGFYTREVAVLPALPNANFPPGVLVLNQADGQYYLSDVDTTNPQIPIAVWTANPNIDRATYVYPNEQEAADIWFHDHVLGFTRLNVYAGIAGGYVIMDNDVPSDPGSGVHSDLRDPTQLIPLVIQDRIFDTTGQLYFAAGGTTPEHPYWVPEFIGDTIVVNGKAWPYLNVEAKKYRFLFLNGSNARSYELYLNDIDNNLPGPPMWVIGTDGGFLDAPAKIDPSAVPPQKLVIMPGERYEVVVDFTNFPNRRLQLWNTAKTPYPFGGPPTAGTKRIMEIRVVADPALVAATATGYDPAVYDPLVPTTSPRVDPIVPLGGLTPLVKRQLTLNEIVSVISGTPLEAVLNNTKWDGLQVIENPAPPNTIQTRADFSPVNVHGTPYYYSELPGEGTVEVWEIINITADAHPIHLHLAQFQILGRQPFDPLCYNAVYDASFPTGLFQPGYGPPLTYNIPNADGAIGGNPAASQCYMGMPARPPGPFESGWKDTAVMYPNEVTRIAVRWTPTDIPNTVTDPTLLGFPFDPNHGHGYVWHCHILDHEDNEMMRPTQVNTNELFPPGNRSFVKGIDY